MVAFMCNKPAMYHDEETGWVEDHSTDCISDPVKILEYCRSVSDETSFIYCIHMVIK